MVCVPDHNTAVNNKAKQNKINPRRTPGYNGLLAGIAPFEDEKNTGCGHWARYEV